MLLTPGPPPHETEFISSIRSGTCRACAAPTSGATLSASPRDADGARMCATDGYCGEAAGMKHSWSGYLCSVATVTRGSAAQEPAELGNPFRARRSRGRRAARLRAALGDPREVAGGSSRSRSPRRRPVTCLPPAVLYQEKLPYSSGSLPSSSPSIELRRAPATSARASVAASVSLSSSKLIAEDQVGAERVRQRGGHARATSFPSE